MPFSFTRLESLTEQDTIYVLTIILERLSFSKSVCWIIFDSMYKKAVSEAMKGNEVEKLVCKKLEKRQVV